MRWFFVGLILWSSYAESGTRVQVEGHGPGVEQAKQNGFRNAIEQVVGQVIVSDQEVQGDQLTKDFIGGYSAGYVDDFEILETRQEGNETIIKMNVAVASSKIAQRMMSSGNKSMMINGQRLQAQLDTQLDQRSRGDQLIAEVLTSYPYNAYVINSGQTEIFIGRRRETYVEVPYQIYWSRFWLEGFNELLTLVAADSKTCNTYFVKQDNNMKVSYTKSLFKFSDTPCGQEADLRMTYKLNGNWFADTHSYYFHDLKTLELINSELQSPIGQQHLGLRVNLLDAGGNILDSRCEKINAESLVSYREPTLEVVHWNQRKQNLRPQIDGQASIRGVIPVVIKQTDLVGDLAKINLSIEKTCG